MNTPHRTPPVPFGDHSGQSSSAGNPGQTDIKPGQSSSGIGRQPSSGIARQSSSGIARRRFVAAAAATSAFTLSRSAHAAGDSIIRVGLVGCGGRGSGAAINAMKADPNVRIVALADLFGDSITRCRTGLSRQYPEQFIVNDDQCFEGFDGYKQLLATDIDVVLLASPPYYRPDHIEASVAAGKHVFCEKPVATDVSGVGRVRKACQDADAKDLNVVSGLCWRYDAGMMETVDRIKNGDIGDIISTQMNYLTGPLWVKPKRPDETAMHHQCRNWYNHVWLSGDHIVEQHIHSLDKAVWLYDDAMPVSAVGLGGRLLRSELAGDIYDHFATVYTWADGSKTHAYTRQIKGCKNQTEDFVYGSRGSAQLIRHQIDPATPKNTASKLGTSKDAASNWRFSGDEVQMHQAEQNEFFKAIRGDRDRINNGDYMCNSTLMAILGRETCYTGKEIKMDDLIASNMTLGPEQLDFDAAPPPVMIRIPGQYDYKQFRPIKRA